MRRAELVRLAGRMKWIAEDDGAADLQFIRDQRGHPASHRFAADEEPWSAAELRGDVAPRLEQDRLAIGCAALPAGAPRGHVRKFEADHADAALPQLARDGAHERRVHGSARAMGENVYLLGGVWTVG